MRILLIVFIIFSVSFSSDIKTIKQLINDDKLIEATDKLLLTKSIKPNDLEIKKLLVVTFLKRGLYEKAEEQLNYLLSIGETTEHLYLLAKLYLLKNQWKSCQEICYRILAKERRHIPTMLLLAKVHEENKYLTLAETVYKDIFFINNKNKDFLIQYSPVFN